MTPSEASFTAVSKRDRLYTWAYCCVIKVIPNRIVIVNMVVLPRVIMQGGGAGFQNPVGLSGMFDLIRYYDRVRIERLPEQRIMRWCYQSPLVE